MLKIISELFTVVLMLLQFVAPLIHAHSNSAKEFVSIWHIPEFEQIDSFALSKSKLTSVDNYGMDVIVTVSAGVKSKVKPYYEKGDSHFALLYFLSLCLVCYINRLVQPNNPCVVVSKKYFFHSVRAPPINVS